VNDWVEPGESVALAGETPTIMCARTVTCALALCDGFAWLTAEIVTGFGDGTEVGAA
jgi:hypothetical protein